MAVGESVDVILTRLEVKMDEVLDRSKDHEARLRRLEKASQSYITKSQVYAAVTAAASSGGGLVVLLQNLVGK